MLTNWSILSNRHIVIGPIEDGAVVIPVGDLYSKSADVFQPRTTVIGGLDGYVDELLPIRFISVENLQSKRKNDFRIQGLVTSQEKKERNQIVKNFDCAFHP